MNRFEDAVADLIAAAAPNRASVEDAYTAARVLLEEEQADAAACNRALGKLADALPGVGLECSGVAAVACGALVEKGADPLRALDALLGRLPEVLAGANAFAAACQKAADGAPALDDADDPVERFGEDVARARPADAIAWNALELFGMAAIAMLTRSAAARKKARAIPDLLPRTLALAELHGRAGFLADVLRVLDDEDLVVLHPETGRGWRVRVSGIADNFQLHTLLADALIGDPDKGLLPGKRPDPLVAAAAHDQPVHPSAEYAEGAFNLMNWRALRPDGTLPDDAASSEHWIWNEGTPADIAEIDGVRVVLLAPAPYHRTWNAGRRFEDMTGDLRVVETLTPEAARQWLDRIAKAPRTPGG